MISPTAPIVLMTEQRTRSSEIDGLSTIITQSGIGVARLHYTADPLKRPGTFEGDEFTVHNFFLNNVTNVTDVTEVSNVAFERLYKVTRGFL